MLKAKYFLFCPVIVLLDTSLQSKNFDVGQISLLI